ncbi:hypothetical protein J7T10_15440, partial [Providencia rettgeri]
MKKILLPTLTLVFFLTSVFFYYRGNYNNIPELNCYAQVRYNYYSDNGFDVMDSGIGFSLENGQGTIFYSAALKRGKEVFNIKRDVKVSYKVTENNSFLITVYDINISPLDNLPESLANKYMYSYTREKGGWFNINVKPNGGNGYIMYTPTIP